MLDKNASSNPINATTAATAAPLLDDNDNTANTQQSNVQKNRFGGLYWPLMIPTCIAAIAVPAYFISNAIMPHITTDLTVGNPVCGAHHSPDAVAILCVSQSCVKLPTLADIQAFINNHPLLWQGILAQDVLNACRQYAAQCVSNPNFHEIINSGGPSAFNIDCQQYHNQEIITFVKICLLTIGIAGMSVASCALLKKLAPQSLTQFCSGLFSSKKNDVRNQLIDNSQYGATIAAVV